MRAALVLFAFTFAGCSDAKASLSRDILEVCQAKSANPVHCDCWSQQLASRLELELLLKVRDSMQAYIVANETKALEFDFFDGYSLEERTDYQIADTMSRIECEL